MSATCSACGFQSGFEVAVCPECGAAADVAAGPPQRGFPTGGPTVLEGGPPQRTVFANEATHVASRAVAGACLFVKDGADRGRQFMLGDLTVIGRDGNCELPLDDPRVSARHAQVRKSRGQWLFLDLESRNGSFLCNDGTSRRIRASHTLADNDEIRVGDTILKFIQMRGR